jgi:hypothetical protein
MSFYFNAAICLLTFMVFWLNGLCIKKGISNCEMSTTTYTAYVF